MRNIYHKQSSIRSDQGTRRGYTLLFAIIVASLVLGVAVFILSVSKKQFALSVAARDSMYAIYAADSGMECAAATNLATGTPSAPTNLVITCNGAQSDPAVAFVQVTTGIDQSVWPSGSGIYQASDIGIKLDIGSSGVCARVTVTDGYYIENSVTKHKTIIESRGYNYCKGANPEKSPRTVERALRLTYR